MYILLVKESWQKDIGGLKYPSISKEVIIDDCHMYNLLSQLRNMKPKTPG